MLIQRRAASTGRVGDKLVERGYVLDVRCPMEGDTLPESMDQHAGAVVFGGPMSANDDGKLPALRAQLDWIPVVLDAGRPFLGICLGAQLLARVLGARVAPHPDALAEIGYFHLRPTPAGDPYFEQPLAVYHWHQEGFDLPGDALLLACGETFPNQAYRYGDTAFGLQFHPEVTERIMDDWLQRSATMLTLPGAQPAELHRPAHGRHGAAMETWLDGFLGRWLGAGRA